MCSAINPVNSREKKLDGVPNRLNENQVCIISPKKGSPDFDYIMGVEVRSTENIPEGMERFTLPKSEYAAMPFVKRRNADVLKGFTYLVEEWLPQSDYIRELEKPGFIYYDERFLPIYREQGYAGNPVAELYVPVRPKERKPDIVTKDDMHVIGLVLHTSFQEGRQAREIPPFFHTVAEEKKWDGVPNRINANQVCIFKTQPDSPEFDYMISVEVSSLDEIPEGMESLTLPASDYVAMPFVKRGNADGMSAINYIMKEWLPTSGYAPKPTPVFIYYDDERFFSIYHQQGYAGNPVGEFYVPVIKK
jgi:predicted transcriptional regulator YdeE